MKRTLPVAVALTAGAAAPAAPQAFTTETGPRPLRLHVSNADGGTRLVCGQRKRVSLVTQGARSRLRVEWRRNPTAGRRRLTVAIDRCSKDRWVPQTRIARRTGGSGPGRLTRAIPTAATGAFRVRARLGQRRRDAFVVVREDVVDVPVSFLVRNSNRTNLACPSDGREYRLAGRLTAPREILTSSVRSVTLLLHEFGFGRWFWSLAVPGYDYAHELARAGHASVAIDRLGYDDSDPVPGMDTCLGAHADMAHQVIQQLRAGSYASPDLAPVSFARVALAGHSIGGQVAELEAASFADIDALLLFAAADQGFRPRATQEAVEQGIACAAGGSTSEKGAPGYAFFGSPEESRDFAYFDTDPAVLDAALPRRNSDPCGDVSSTPQLLVANNQGVGSIQVPVLLLFGTDDAIYEQPSAGESQRELFGGSSDVTLKFFERTGHALVLERSAPRVREVVAGWLGERGL